MSVELSALVIVAVAIGGALGAVLRFLLDAYFTAGVLIANTVGSLLIGGFIGASAAVSGAASGPGSVWDDPTIGLAVIGFLGALSTFATVSLRAAQRWVAGERFIAAGLWLAHVTCGLVAVSAGLWAGWELMG